MIYQDKLFAPVINQEEPEGDTGYEETEEEETEEETGDEEL